MSRPGQEPNPALQQGLATASKGIEVKSDATKFFRSPADLHRWFVKNHARTNELWIGFHRGARQQRR
jgi:hypothetical protein